ncbi:glycosyltransferase [Streptomyces sp. MAI_2237]
MIVPPHFDTFRTRRRGEQQADMTVGLSRTPVDLELIVPVFNEERRLPQTLATTLDYLNKQRWKSAVVVVDNDSVDGTDEVVSRFTDDPVAIHLIGCSEHGKGAAVRRGFSTSSAHYVGFIDADGATPIGTLGRMMALLERDHSAVIASRRAPGAHYRVEQPPARRLGGWVFRSLAGLTLPDIADSQCGFKFFNGDAVRQVIDQCRINGFAFDVELLGALVRHGHDVIEVPVAWSDVPGSTFSIRRDGLRSVTDLARIALDRR